MIQMPTSSDICIEINGNKIGIAQSYRVMTKNKNPYPHTIELNRVCFKSNYNIQDLSGFNIIVVKPDRRIIYSGCEWAKISETSSNVMETVEVLASKRIELSN